MIIPGAIVISAAILGGSPSYGVGMQGHPVCIPAARMTQASSYSLGKVQFQDTGTAAEDVALWPMTFQGATAPWAGWLSYAYPKLLGVVGQDHVHLGPGQWATIPVTLNIPPDAKPGQYGGYLNATVVQPGSPGIHLGGGGNTVIRFAVGTAADCSAKTPPGPVTPDGGPTAGYTPGAVRAAQSRPPASPSPAASSGNSPLSELAWVGVAAILVIAILRFATRRR